MEKVSRAYLKDSFSILIVDDALTVRTHLQKKLNELLPVNCSVDVACDGGEALNLSLKKLALHKPYNLIFMDSVMPVIDGYRACKEIKNRTDTPVVMLTCNGSTWNEVKAKLAKCDDYLKKPPKEADLQVMVLKYIPQLEGLLNEITAAPDTAANF
jgi:CheY-like chemotaxis protein